MGLRVEGVTEASLTSDCLLHACCSIHGGGRGGGGMGGRGKKSLKRGFGRKMFLRCTATASNLGPKPEFHVGWSGWTNPPTLQRGGSRVNRSAKRGVGGGVVRGF